MSKKYEIKKHFILMYTIYARYYSSSKKKRRAKEGKPDSRIHKTFLNLNSKFIIGQLIKKIHT